MQVAQVDRVFRDVVAEIVGRAVGHAALHAAAGEPDGERAAVMVAAHRGIAELALAEDGAAELRGEDHERVIQQAALLEILHERGCRLVDVVALIGELARNRDVLIPAAVKKLNETHIALEQAAREQAVGGVGAGLPHLGAVGVERGGALLGNVGELRHAGLHAKRHLVGVDARDRLGIAQLGGAGGVERGEIVEHGATLRAIDAGRVVQIEHRIRAGPEADTLMGGGQKAAAPEAREDRLARIFPRALRDHRDEGGEVLVLAAEAVARPRAHAGVAGKLIPGVHERDRRVVVDGLGVQRLDEADVVGDCLMVRQQIADPRAVLAAEFARLERGHHRIGALVARHAGEALRAFDRRRDLLAGVLVEHRLVVEKIDVRETAALEEAKHALGGGLEMREAGLPLALRLDRLRDGRGQQRAERDAADAAGRAADEGAAGEMSQIVGERSGGLHGHRYGLNLATEGTERGHRAHRDRKTCSGE